MSQAVDVFTGLLFWGQGHCPKVPALNDFRKGPESSPFSQTSESKHTNATDQLIRFLICYAQLFLLNP